MKKYLIGASALSLIVSFQPATAQDAATPAPSAPPAPCTSEMHDDFDFWVGEWNVYGPGGNYAGHNSIRKINGGCLIWEHWVGGNGNPGDSMNFYDPIAGAWRQVWVSQGATIDYTGGLNDDGEMILNGKIAYPGNGLIADFRGTWTPLEDGSVRQYFQQLDAEGVWRDWFTGLYVREEDDPKAEEAAAAREAADQ